jgi:hypothetical protein
MDFTGNHNVAAASSNAQAVAGAFFDNAWAPRVNTDALILTKIRNNHVGVHVTTVPEYGCNLKAYAAAGHAVIEDAAKLDETTGSTTCQWPEALRWTRFVPPVKRLDHGDGGAVVDQAFFESYVYKWRDLEFFVYLVDGRDGGGSVPRVRNQYVLGDEAAVRTLVGVVGGYEAALHEEIWVFNKGFWAKDHLLYRSILKARWEDVILDKPLKEDLVETVQRFFDSRRTYSKLRVPWRRGIIFHGPPGNGKTISIKATMHTLYQRDPPVPTLYVKSLVSNVPPEYSIESIFAKARQQAPCYLVFEDLDSLVTDQVRSFFLNAVDGLSENEGILMVGSTNHLERLDPGISKRPSRFDRKYLFPNPDFDQRVLYCRYWQRKLGDNDDVPFPDEICRAASEITDGFSFAYIQEAFVAALLAIAAEANIDAEVGLEKEKVQSDDGLEELHDIWTLVNITDECPVRTERKEKDLDDYILWRKLKQQIELLRKEMGNEEQGGG